MKNKEIFIFILVIGALSIFLISIFYNKQKLNYANFYPQSKKIPLQIKEVPIKEQKINLQVKEINPQEIKKELNSKSRTETNNASSLNSTSTKNSIDNFAKCLAEKGVELYVSKTCPHCARQKEMFSSSLQYLKYFDCLDNPEICIKKGVEVVPTWILPNGEKLLGVQSLEILSQKTECKLQ
jgi:glutaredoxin